MVARRSPSAPVRGPTYHRQVTTLDAPPPLRLTTLTDCGGCAAKLGADLLADALSGLGAEAALDAPGNLIAGLDPPDDGAAYRVSDDLAIIGTLDFFPPLVDDPRTFGEIAAANALSDVFAMGGRVLFALSIAAFPEDLPRDVLAAIFEGASSKVREAGRHARRRPHDPGPGAQVRARGDRGGPPRQAAAQGWSEAGRRPDPDQAIGNRCPGLGIASGTRTSEADLATAVEQMRTLNRAASEVLVAHGIRAATDVTGFGLLGHGLEMARASGTCFVFEAAALPALPGALELAAAGVETGGAAHNRRFVLPALAVGADIPPELVTLAHDPQTSGGLLAAIPAAEVDEVTLALNDAGVQAWASGACRPGSRASR